MKRATGISSDRRSVSGFTLLEVLVAITLLALISVILLGGFRIGTRVWERSLDAYEQGDELGQARKFLSSWLAQAYPAVTRTDPLNPVLRFEGAEHSLHMMVPAPQAIVPGGWGVLTLSTAPGDRGANLVASFQPDNSSNSAAVPSVVLTGVEEIALSYWGPEAPLEDSQWQPNWTGRAELPDLIRVSVRFPPGDGRQWSDLIVALPVSAAFDCEYDALAQRCRGR